MKSSKETLNELYRELREILCLEQINSLLWWDQKTYMPTRGAASRAAQMALLDRLVHERKTSERMNQTVEALSAQTELGDDERINLHELTREIKRARALPTSFVAERSEIQSLCYMKWLEARPKSDFAAVEPLLSKLVELARQEASLIGYKGHPYDALLEAYEAYATLEEVKPLLLSLAQGIREMLPEITAAQGERPEIKAPVSAEVQHALGVRLITDLGLRPEFSRLDITAHPFVTKVGAEDIRVTTRYYEEDFYSAISSTLHEAGHALYEIGLPAAHLGTPLGRARSLGIHESQSRLWENVIGRGAPYMRYLHRVMGECALEMHVQYTPEELYRIANYVTPSLIRIEADEVTYSLHVVIRMLLEIRLIEGSLEVADLPEAWNALYQEYLGILPDSANHGVMQDMHWYTGSFGYFPTYALGNLYGALFYDAMALDIPEIEQKIEHGTFEPLREWLNEKVYRHGMRFTPRELARRATGKDLTVEPFLNYLKRKFLPLSAT